jgi:hypothetical protein
LLLGRTGLYAKTHGAIPIAAHQRTQIRQLILDCQPHPQNAALQQGKERAGLPAFALEEEGGLQRPCQKS